MANSAGWYEVDEQRLLTEKQHRPHHPAGNRHFRYRSGIEPTLSIGEQVMASPDS